MHKYKPGDRVKVDNGDGTKEITRIAELLELNGKPYYTVVTRGNFPIPEYILEPAPESDDDLIMLFDEDEEEIDEIVVSSDYYHDIGDIVTVNGYDDRLFRVIERHTEISETADLDEPCVVVYYRVVPEGVEPDAFNTFVAFEEDVDLVCKGSRDDGHKFRHAGNNPCAEIQLPEEIAPSPEEITEKIRTSFSKFAAGVLERKKAKAARSEHRAEEKRKLAALEKNRKMIERARVMIDDYLDLYNAFRDEKYLRKIERLTKFIERVPSRAYEIE